jgi:hypothetical protein
MTTATQSAPLTGIPFVPALSGHRLAFVGDVAVVSDPEGPNEDGTRPQVHLASLSQMQLLASLNLPVGSNPESVAAASDGYAYVVAAGLGGVIAVDVARQKLGAFSATCPAPVDIATRGTDVLVACRGGEVVTLTSDRKETTLLPQQLARIAVDPTSRVFLATIDAEIIELGVAAAVAPATVALTGGGRVAHGNTPRRLLSMPSGGVLLQFQQSLTGELTEQGAPVQYYGGGGPTCPMPATRAAMSTYASGPPPP